jgi:hypothetical protein
MYDRLVAFATIDVAPFRGARVMASIHPELAEITIKAAQWLVDTNEPLDWPVIPILKERFKLTQVQALQAMFEAAYAVAIAGGLGHEKACEAGLMALFAESAATSRGERRP